MCMSVNAMSTLTPWQVTVDRRLLTSASTYVNLRSCTSIFCLLCPDFTGLGRLAHVFWLQLSASRGSESVVHSYSELMFVYQVLRVGFIAYVEICRKCGQLSAQYANALWLTDESRKLDRLRVPPFLAYWIRHLGRFEAADGTVFVPTVPAFQEAVEGVVEPRFISSFPSYPLFPHSASSLGSFPIRSRGNPGILQGIRKCSTHRYSIITFFPALIMSHKQHRWQQFKA